MNATAIIPARYASTRLPGKPLLAETGKPLIQHVVEAVRSAGRIERIVVATDDDRIVTAVQAFGAEAVMTSETCRTGTDRLAEAARKLALPDETIIVNVQGDEPDIPPSCLDTLVALLESCDSPVATLATPISYEDATDPNKVKVVCDTFGRALYFSRARIPYDRDDNREGRYLLHLGVYAYRAEFLKVFSGLDSTPAESAESLEQLRLMERGYNICVTEVDYDGVGIDTPADYEAFVRRVGGK